MAIGTSTLLLALLAACAPQARAPFDFDDGTTQGWQVAGAVHDDQGIAYTPALFAASHFEAAQHPSSFPGGDPLNDQRGSLLLNGYQMAPWAATSNFPPNAKYWEISAHFAGLQASADWQGIQGVRLSIGDNYGATPGHVTATVGVRARIAGQDHLIGEVGAGNNTVFHPVNHQSTGQWTDLKANLSVPADAEVYLVFVQIRGDWQNYKAYDGGIMIDHVAPIKP